MYIFCDEDTALQPFVQNSFPRTLGNSVTFHVEASHSGFLSKPEGTVGGLEIALKAGLEHNGINQRVNC